MLNGHPITGDESDAYEDMHRERMRAHAKHDKNGGGMERKPWNATAWLPVLVEEVGEVARALCERALGNTDELTLRAQLREELVQVGAMTAAWIDALDGGERVSARDALRAELILLFQRRGHFGSLATSEADAVMAVVWPERAPNPCYVEAVVDTPSTRLLG